jgi:hypothetical protein
MRQSPSLTPTKPRLLVACVPLAMIALIGCGGRSESHAEKEAHKVEAECEAKHLDVSFCERLGSEKLESAQAVEQINEEREESEEELRQEEEEPVTVRSPQEKLSITRRTCKKTRHEHQTSSAVQATMIRECEHWERLFERELEEEQQGR